MAQGTCVKCGAEDRYLPGRSLCAKCYDHHWRRGTLDEFPCRPLKVPEPRTHRVCPICKVDLPLDAFARSKDRWDGHATYCKPCAREKYQRPARARKALIERPVDGEQECRVCGERLRYSNFYWERDKGRYGTECKSCRRLADRARHEANPTVRRSAALRKFGLTLDEYDRMAADQDGVCAICRDLCPSGRRLAVDHDHSTGAVRGLLCENCNRALGLFQDDPIRMTSAADYIRASAPLE